MEKDLFLYTLVNDKGEFEVFRAILTPVWVRNSVYVMDHDSTGRCYCRGYYNNSKHRIS